MTTDGPETGHIDTFEAPRPPEDGPVCLANYIGGRWRPADGVATLDDVDPASGQASALVPLSGAMQVHDAVNAARAAQPGWREVPPQRRARALLALREELLRRREELVALVSADMGKTLADADGEVGRGIESVESAAAILEDPDIDAVSFVGRAETARIVAEGAVRTGKRVQALGGAKNSLVVMPDAELEQAVPAIMGSAFGAAGQRCLAGSVCVLVGDESRRAEVRAALVAAAAELVVGPGKEPSTDVCPMVSATARERVAEAVGRAEDGGAELLLDGRGAAGPAGTLLGPTIAVADPESELAREELFGPLLTLVEMADLDTALGFLNGSRYGNAGTIFTCSGEAARHYRYGAEAGMLGVNVGVPAPVAWFPFAGWKDSCDGDLHANGSDAVDFYTRKKVVTSRW